MLLHLTVNKLNLNCVDELGNLLPNALSSYETTLSAIRNFFLFLRIRAAALQEGISFGRFSKDYLGFFFFL